MEFTFGILTAGNNNNMLQTIVDSIEMQDIPTYEILIIGDCTLSGKNLRVLPFDESIRNGWITKKKNILAQEAMYENLVLLHDYIALDKGWYEGFLKFGDNFDICTTQIKDLDGKRYIDFAFHPFYVTCLDSRFESGCLLPYDYKPTRATNKLLYISGTYYIIKKHLALFLPLDEMKTWGQGEDMDLSFAITHLNIEIQCNSNSSVSCLKLKGGAPWIQEIQDTSLLEKLQTLTEEDAHKWFYSKYGNLLNSYTIFKNLRTK